MTGATVDMTHFVGREPIDQIDLTANFTNNELAEGKRCEPADNLLFHGVKVTVQQGFCGAKTTKSNVTIPFFQPLAPRVHWLISQDFQWKGPLSMLCCGP